MIRLAAAALAAVLAVTSGATTSPLVAAAAAVADDAIIGTASSSSYGADNSFLRRASTVLQSSSSSPPSYAIAYDMADLAERAYGSLGVVAGFFFIPNDKVDLKDTPYTLRKIYKLDSDFAFTAQSKDACVVAFRGSDQLTPADWTSNFDADGVPFRKMAAAAAAAAQQGGEGDIMAYVHQGDMEGYQKFYLDAKTGFLKDIAECLKRSTKTKLYITGHSRGGAMAAIMAIQMRFDEGLDAYGSAFARLRKPSSKYLNVYTIGENRNLIEKDPSTPGSLAAITQTINKYRFVNKRDLVPSVPTFSFNKKDIGGAGFVHWGTPLHHAGDNKIESVKNNFPTEANETLNILDHIPSSYKSFLLAAAKKK